MMNGSKEQDITPVTPEDLLRANDIPDEGSDDEFLRGTTPDVSSSQCEPDTKQDSSSESEYEDPLGLGGIYAQQYDDDVDGYGYRRMWHAPSGEYYNENVILEQNKILLEDSLGTPHWTWEPVGDTDMVRLTYTPYPLPDPVYVWRAPSGIYYRSGQLEWSNEIPDEDRHDTEWTWEVDVDYNGRERLRHHSSASESKNDIPASQPQPRTTQSTQDSTDSESKRDDIPPAQPEPPTTQSTQDSLDIDPADLYLHISPSPPSSPDAGPSSPKRRRTNAFSPINIRF